MNFALSIRFCAIFEQLTAIIIIITNFMYKVKVKILFLQDTCEKKLKVNIPDYILLISRC